jgi:hypothetical protein
MQLLMNEKEDAQKEMESTSDIHLNTHLIKDQINKIVEDTKSTNDDRK